MFFTTQRPRWYPNGTKSVPKDIQLTPIVCLYWYLGDGGLHYCKSKFKGVRLCTNAFLISDIDFLRGKLLDLGFRSFREKKGVIGLSPIQARNFLGYIGDCPVDCYRYKWCPDNREKYNQLIGK